MPEVRIRKTASLILLNIAAAAAIGIMAGLLYKYYGESDGVAGELRDRIKTAVDSLDARIGVGVILPDGDSLMVVGGIHGDTDEFIFPMLSVFKFHQALAVCGRLRDAGIPLSDEIPVNETQLPEGTWSPLRDEFPLGGEFSWTELLEYTLVYSDNNACDILFGLTGGPSWTDSYIRTLGLNDFNIECTEKMMHENPADCMKNWCTPLSAAMLLEKFYDNRDADEYSRFVWNTMSGCRTGAGRIPKYIREQCAVIVHKTGTGDMTADGRIMAANDIGTVILPDGRHFSLAVFITDAGCSMEECEETIAVIARIVMEYVMKS